MSSSSGYLIPQKPFIIGQFEKRMKSCLEEDMIINGFYDPEEGLLAAGQKSHALFSGEDDQANPAFEYAEIRDADIKRLIPEGIGPDFVGHCIKCGDLINDPLSDSLNELYEKEYDTGQRTDMSSLEFICETCNHLNKLGDIQFKGDTILISQYVQFVDINDSFDPVKIEWYENRLDCKLRIIYERF